MNAPDSPRCPFCGNEDQGCEHLLLSVESGELISGALYDDAILFNEAFWSIFREVARRNAVCGTGILLEATKAFFSGHGYIADSNELHAELDRNYALEYLLDLLDLAPNVERIRSGTAPDANEYAWSETPNDALKLAKDRLRELERLAALPDNAPEWIPAERE